MIQIYRQSHSYAIYLTGSLLLIERESLPVTLLGFLKLLSNGVLFSGGKGLPTRFNVLNGNIGRSVTTLNDTSGANTGTGSNSTEHV